MVLQRFSFLKIMKIQDFLTFTNVLFSDETEGEATTSTCNGVVQEKDYGTLESKL